MVRGRSEKKIKGKYEGDKATKEKIFVELEVEKTEFHEATNQLRVLGLVVRAKPAELVEFEKLTERNEVSLNTLEASTGSQNWRMVATPEETNR